ncbi:hypothetical protein AnigIFM62618_005314 [Aspergillus niger]|nr:hypothetical protein AnigIFM62618_005314 [Aspergillus niger]
MVNRAGLSCKHIFDAVDASVQRLGTYIDVLQIHRLDNETPRDEIMRALNDVVESGKVRYIGASSRVDEVAKRKGISMAQVSLAWTLSHPGTNPVVGMNTKECIDEAVASIHVHLTYKEVTYLEDAYVPKRL